MTVSHPTPEYFITISELMEKREKTVDKAVRVSGVVIGESIQYTEETQLLTFYIANVPASYDDIEGQGGLAKVLEDAVKDPTRPRLEIFYIGENPELLHHMAQVIAVGKLREDGIFYAEEILLKCPSRYEEAVPEQAVD